ncbi:MAG: glycosyltransferase [Betaproteobacteria bacterium]|nr:glycosyltransferase [Betaproteobacteria bacterium]
MGLAPLKNRLKGLPWAYRLNARWKSNALKREYAAIRAHYAGKAPAGELRQLLVQRAGERLPRLPLAGRPSIFFLGTDELQDRGGILQALERRGKLTAFTRADGSYGQNHPGPEAERRATNTQRLLALFAELHARHEVPDLLIAQTWAGFVEPGALTRIREAYGTVVVNIALDDRHQYQGRKVNGEWWGTRGLIPHIDLALTAAPECVEWYLKEGCPAIFFPEASDPDIFHPMPELPKVHDVSFVGARYGVREQIVTALGEAGIRVTACGTGWRRGRLGNDQVPRLFAQSKIVLGVGTIGHCEDFYALKLRDFDAPMSGSFYLTHDNPDLRAVYEVGREIETYRSIAECVDKVRAFLGDEAARERIARDGRERAVRDHTWDRRFGDLVSLLMGAAASSAPP